MPTGKYVHLDSATLATMLTNLKAAHAAVCQNQSYSIAGRTLSRANMAEITNDLSEVSFAIAAQAGNVVRTTYPDMSNTAG